MRMRRRQGWMMRRYSQVTDRGGSAALPDVRTAPRCREVEGKDERHEVEAPVKNVAR